MRMLCYKIGIKGSVNPPSCFTVSRRYATEDNAIIHAAHAIVQNLVLRASSLPSCDSLYLCLRSNETRLKI